MYLSIACLEEIGKIGVERFRMALHEASRMRFGTNVFQQREANLVGSRRGPAYSHPKKHLLAAGGGALINARLDRILGMEAINQLLADVESGAVEQLRQSCLYTDRTGSGVHVPAREIARDRASFWAALAGELLAEILGFEPEEFERLLANVKLFEDTHGIAAE